MLCYNYLGKLFAKSGKYTTLIYYITTLKIKRLRTCRIHRLPWVLEVHEELELHAVSL